MKEAFLIGIIASILLDIYSLFTSDGLLLFIGCLGLIVAIWGLCQNLSQDDELKIAWMTCYVIPSAIGAFGIQAGNIETQNKFWTQFGYNPIVIDGLGKAKDYESALISMMVSFAMPFLFLIGFCFFITFKKLINLFDDK